MCSIFMTVNLTTDKNYIRVGGSDKEETEQRKKKDQRNHFLSSHLTNKHSLHFLIVEEK